MIQLLVFTISGICFLSKIRRNHLVTAYLVVHSFKSQDRVLIMLHRWVLLQTQFVLVDIEAEYIESNLQCNSL